jgi:hypothetical protein
VTTLPLRRLLGMSCLRPTCRDECCFVSAQYVIWPRIDQKTCLKAIVTAGMTP